MRDSPRPLALELAHKLDALLKICPLPTGILLNPVCMTPHGTTILITTTVTHAHSFLLSPRERYGALDARLALRRDLRTSPTSSETFGAPATKKYHTSDVSNEHNSGISTTAGVPQDYTTPISSYFLLRLTAKIFSKIFAVPAYSRFLPEPDYDILLHQTFDETLPSRQSPQLSPTLNRHMATCRPLQTTMILDSVFVLSGNTRTIFLQPRRPQFTNHCWCTARVYSRAQITICFRRISILSDDAIVVIFGWI